MSDIVLKMRQWGDTCSDQSLCDDCTEAADEIDRLRLALDATIDVLNEKYAESLVLVLRQPDDLEPASKPKDTFLDTPTRER